jgi:hypothetical protein
MRIWSIPGKWKIPSNRRPFPLEKKRARVISTKLLDRDAGLIQPILIGALASIISNNTGND